jgi:predicted nucleic acid-binding protein
VHNLLLSSTAGKKVILDSCFLIQSLGADGTSPEQRLLAKLTNEGAKKCITRIIQREVDKWVSKQEGSLSKERWRDLARQLVILKPSQGDVIWEAGHILTHYPDNQHIATAKIEGSSLVPYDGALIRTARYEGIEAYYPMELLMTS